MRPQFAIASLAASLFGNYVLGASLYAASYSGTVTSLALTESGGSHHLSVLSKTTDCGGSPSWLMLDNANDILYCLDEGIDAPNGTLSSFKTYANGSLTTIQRLKTLPGPVMSTMYSAPGVPGRQFLAVAHYEGSSMTSYTVDPVRGLLNRSQSFTYEMPSPGPVASRQDAPHPHGVFIDPTGQYLLVPDLGADIVRIYHINPTTGHLELHNPLAVTKGSGPRHGVFWTLRGSKTPSQDVYFYLVHELSNGLSGYGVNYSDKGISFEKFYEGSSYGEGDGPAGSKVAEIAISPENNQLVLSNRLDNTFGAKNDSLAVFTCAEDGVSAKNLSFVGLYPAHGSSPRHFSINGMDGKLAVALESSQRVAVVEWDEDTEMPGALQAERDMDGDITAVVWGT